NADPFSLVPTIFLTVCSETAMRLAAWSKPCASLLRVIHDRGGPIPLGDICSAANWRLFDHLVSAAAAEPGCVCSVSVFLVTFANGQWACIERAVSPGDLQEDIDVDCFQIFLRHLHLNARPDHAVIVD